MKTNFLIMLIPLAFTLVLVAYLPSRSGSSTHWTESELASLQSLWLRNLPPVPHSPSNRVADNPDAAKLGQRLFFDTRLSKNGRVSCATCHQPHRKFTDGITLAEGMRVGTRNTQALVGTAYSPWYFWDGRKDSLWSQALAPLESKIEHGGNRHQYATLLSLDGEYRTLYEKTFGSFPDISDDDAVTKVFVNMGKSLAAYQRLLLPGESRFDRYVDRLINGSQYPPEDILNKQEINGLKLFIGKANCTNCHNGPLFSNFSFHNTGIFPRSGGTPDLGRIEGVELVREDPFNCLGSFSDDPKHQCDELRYMKTDNEVTGAQKTPSLRALINTQPYMHAGQFATLGEVLRHYNTAEGAFIDHNEAKPLNLTQSQLDSIEAFLRSLDGPIAVESHWLNPPPGMEEGGTLTQRSSAY